MRLGDKQYYLDLFYELMERYEIKVYNTQDENGVELLKIKTKYDYEKDQRNYIDFEDILDSLEDYHNSYLVKDIEEIVKEYCDSGASYKELVDAYFSHADEFDGECEWEARALDLVVNSNVLFMEREVRTINGEDAKFRFLEKLEREE